MLQESLVRSPSEEKNYNFVHGAKVVLLEGPMNILLLLIPFALASWFADWSQPVTFCLSLVALAPLAERLGYVTEQIAMHTNDTIGGLLNATFGNATELILSIAALQQNLFRVVQLSLLGSVLSNLLLVLGCAFFYGGLYHKHQVFGTISGQINAGLLMLSAMGLLFPAILSMTNEEDHTHELDYSRATSVILLVLYLAFLYFQLSTHKDAYEELPADLSPKHAAQFARDEAAAAAQLEEVRKTDKAEDDDDEEEEDTLGLKFAVVWLAVITVFISLLSEALVSSIEAAAENISGVFLSAIVLPIVGNACEHASAVVFARKNKLDLALGIAVGSSTQIALFVLPFTVIMGWILDKDMSLNFKGFETCTLLLTVIIVTFAIKEGKSNWLLGAILMGAYFIVAGGFLVHKDEDLS